MTEQKYNIPIYTPFNIRQVQLSAKINVTTLTGTFAIVRYTMFHVKKNDKRRNCKMLGEFITLIRTVIYIAIVPISETALYLILGEKWICFKKYSVTSSAERKTI